MRPGTGAATSRRGESEGDKDGGNDDDDENVGEGDDDEDNKYGYDALAAMQAANAPMGSIRIAVTRTGGILALGSGGGYDEDEYDDDGSRRGLRLTSAPRIILVGILWTLLVVGGGECRRERRDASVQSIRLIASMPFVVSFVDYLSSGPLMQYLGERQQAAVAAAAAAAAAAAGPPPESTQSLQEGIHPPPLELDSQPPAPPPVHEQRSFQQLPRPRHPRRSVTRLTVRAQLELVSPVLVLPVNPEALQSDGLVLDLGTINVRASLLPRRRDTV